MPHTELGKYNALEARVDALEAEIRSLRSASPIVPPPPAPTAVPIRPVLPSPPTLPTHPSQKPPLDSETILKWGGIGLVVLAVVFAVSNAINRGWVGPGVQLAGAISFSSALIGLGLYLMASRRRWGHALGVGGVLGLFATFASGLFVDLTSSGTGLAACALVALIGFCLAWFMGSDWVGVSALGAGTLSGLALDITQRTEWQSVGWGVSLAVAGILVALARSLHGLRIASHALGLVWLILVAVLLDSNGLSMVEGAGILLLGASLAFVPGIGDRSTLWQRAEIQLAASLAPWLILTLAAGSNEPSNNQVGLISLAVAVAVASVAFALRPILKGDHLISLLIGVGAAVSVSIIAFASGPTLFASLAAQGAGVLILYRLFGRSPRVLASAVLLLGVSSVHLLISTTMAWEELATTGTYLGNAIILACLAFALAQLRGREYCFIGGVLILAASMFAIGSGLVHLPQGQAVVSIAWAIIGVAVLLAGAHLSNHSVGMVGLGVLAITVAKLLTVDLKEVDTMWRAGLFLLVGLGLLRLGFSMPKLMGQSPAEDPG